MEPVVGGSHREPPARGVHVDAPALRAERRDAIVRRLEELRRAPGAAATAAAGGAAAPPPGAAAADDEAAAAGDDAAAADAWQATLATRGLAKGGSEGVDWSTQEWEEFFAQELYFTDVSALDYFPDLTLTLDGYTLTLAPADYIFAYEISTGTSSRSASSS